MLARLLLLFLITPVVELALLLRVGEWIGFWPTVGLILFTGIAGSVLARREGLSVWRRLNTRMNGGQLPGKELIDGVIILIAGALLITPGVLTDLVGFAGLLPPTRALIRSYIDRRLRKKMEEGTVRMYGFGPTPFDAGAADASEMGGQRQTEWGGESRDVPRYAE